MYIVYANETTLCIETINTDRKWKQDEDYSKRSLSFGHL